MADEQNLDTQNPEPQAAESAAPSDDLAARVQALEEQLAAAQDQSLRVAAELQNVRRRAEQDVEKAHKFALEKFANDLLPVRLVREAGLAAVQRVGPLKRFFMQHAMGLIGELPRTMRGQPL